MPSIRIVDNRKPTPLRRIPRGVSIGLVEPSPWVCRACRKLARYYADEVIWCETCGKALSHGDAINRIRGRMVSMSQPPWKPIKVD